MHREMREKQARKQLAQAAREAKKRKIRPALGALSLPEDVLTGQARLTVMGSGRVLVENHTGIVRLEGECVRVRTRQGVLEICGEGLELLEAQSGALYVTGDIRVITLPGKRGEDHA